MRVRLSPNTESFDWRLIGVPVVLSVMGLLLIYSLTWPEENLFVRQIIFLVMGVGVFFGAQLFDGHFWRNASIILYVATLLLLIGLLLFGEATRGARGWIDLGPISFQTAEFAKIAVVLFLATTLEKMHFDLAHVRHLIFAVLLVVVPVGLILLQPDFGSAFIVAAIGSVMILFTGLDKTKLLASLFALVLIATIGWFGVLQPYQQQRVLTFMNPQVDPLGAGYNVRQAVVAIGSGGFWGRGLGLGTQSQLNFLPEQETDFIFASLAEELGFVGAFGVLFLYVLLLWAMYAAIQMTSDLFANFLLLGVFTMFLVQAMINIGMNMGLMPVTGVPLPLVSYGGSSLLVSYFALGLVQNTRR